MVLARFERDFTDEAGNLLTGNVTVTVRRMSGGLPQLYSDRAGASALGNPFINDGGRVAFHSAGNAYRVTVTQGAFSRELTYVALGLGAESDFTFAVNQGVWSGATTYARGDYVIRNGVGIFISTQGDNLNHQPDDTTPGSTAYWTYYPGLVGPAGPAGSGMDWQGAWLTATSYAVGDGVSNGGSSYICLVAHTSGTFATDLAAAKWELFAAKGDTGATGAAGTNGTNGTNGANGADGTDPGVLLTWDDVNADADPGAGNIRADNDALGSATVLYVSKTNRAGDNIAAFLAGLDDSTNTVKGQVTLTRSSGNAQAGFDITGITDATGYVKVAVSGHWGATGFIDGNAISFQFSRAGNKGADGLGAGDVVGPAGAVNNRVATFDGTTGKLIKDSGVVLGTVASLDVDTDTALAANSDVKVASQKATKAYVDQIIAAQDAMVFKGVIDCSTNPNYPAADRGWTYRVSVAGKIGGASGTNVEAGDILLCLTDGTASGNQATVGTAWTVVQANLDGAVIGPASVTDGNPAVFDGVTGKLIKQITFSAFKTALAIAQADVSGLTTASSPQFAGIELGHASDTSITRPAAGRISVEGNPVLLGNTEQQTVAGGANVTVKDLGNLSGASITPNPGNRPIQKITNNGAGSVLPGSNEGQYTLEVINTTGAGAITTTGWTLKGDSFDTTTTSKFVCSCIVTADVKLMTIVKVA